MHLRCYHITSAEPYITDNANRKEAAVKEDHGLRASAVKTAHTHTLKIKT
jgi:hypothetical protein